MIIEIAVNSNDAQKKKGDLLEKIAKSLLESQHYEVETEIRRTGVELDLLCQHKANKSKKIYVECKGYSLENKIEAGIIHKLMGVREANSYREAWLISTTEFGKDAKGLVDKLSEGDRADLYTFFTPTKLVNALVSSNVIKDPNVILHSIITLIKEKNKIGRQLLFITEYGNFWTLEYLSGGKPKGVLLVYADTGEFVKERSLLENLALIESSLGKLDFLSIYKFIHEEKEAIPTIELKNIQFNEEYLNSINDLDIKFTHPSKDDLKLEDIFTFPDLEYIEDDKSSRINSSQLLTLKENHRRIIVFGEDLSGKTALAYSLQRKLKMQSLLPIYIKGEEIKNSDFNKFSNLLVSKFTSQYSDSTIYLNTIRKILDENTAKIVLLIDNFESLGIKRNQSKLAFINMLKEKFEIIYFFANKSLEIEVIAKTETNELLKGFSFYRLMQFGHLLRDEIIEKWLTLDQDETVSDTDIHHKKIEVSKRIEIASGVNYIPTYPIYLLTMLQLVETGTRNELKGSSYAELYRYLINHALGSVRAKPEDLDFYHTYMSNVAYHIFKLKVKELSKDDLEKFYEEYSKKMDIEKSFNSVHKILTKAKLFRYEGNSYSFYHNYCFYFFVAKYLSDNLENSETKNDVKILTEKIFLNQNANIIIFLIHHSKNKEIIDGIISESKKVFKDKVPYNLTTEEMSKINSLIQEEVAYSIVDSNPKENRKKELERRDKIEDERREKKEKDLEKEESYEDDIFSQINLSFKLIEVLGQIINNYYGSLDGEKKAEILEEIYALGFRSLRALLEDFEQYIKVIQNDIQTTLANKGKSTHVKDDKTINKIVYKFIELIVLVFIKRISDSVASKNLFPTTTKVMNRKQIPATKLLNIAVHLNFPEELVKNNTQIVSFDQEFDKNFILISLMKFLVAEHLYRFDVNYNDKQRICNMLGINIIHKGIAPTTTKKIQ